MKKFRVSALYKPDGIERDILLILDEEGRIIEKTKFDGLSKDYLFLDGIVFPTFVNAHTHLELTDFQKIDRVDNLWDWILLVVKNKKSFAEEKFKNSFSNGEKNFYNQGVGCVGDVRSVLPEGPYLYKLHGRIFFEVLGYIEEIFETKLSLLKKFLYFCNANKGISIHSLYTTPFTKALNLIKMARKYKLPIMIHMGETKFESELFFEKKIEGFKKIFPNAKFEICSFKSYGDIIEKLNLSKDVILVHCVEFSKKDFDTIKNKGINLVLCPCSNLYWGDKLPDFKYIMDNEIDFAIGTDSFLTNEVLNIKEDVNLILKNINNEEKYYKKIFDALTYKGRKVLKIKDIGFAKSEFFRALFIPDIYKEEKLYDAFFSGQKIYLIDGKIKDDQIFKKQI